MIHLVQEKGFTRVACFCDACKQEITDADLALYTWNEGDPDYTIGARFTPHFFHKGNCAETTAFNGEHPPWQELRTFPIYLGENIGIDWKRARKTAEIMGSF